MSSCYVTPCETIVQQTVSPPVQDDGHIFCLPDQIASEIRGVLDMVEYVMGAFGFSQLEINLSTKPAKAVGSDEIWEKAEGALREALHTKGWDYKVDEGGGAFYGPKIDVKIQDVLGRKWQCSTIQLDFNLPERFQMVCMLLLMYTKVSVYRPAQRKCRGAACFGMTGAAVCSCIEPCCCGALCSCTQ